MGPGASHGWPDCISFAMRGVEEQRVTTDDGVGLVGSLSLPPSNEPAPLVVVVHGATGGTRTAQLPAHLSSFLPRLGVGVLAFDRRGEGASGGDVRDTSLARLAADIAAWVGAMRQQAQVDERRLGLWAHSQGGWIAPAVAARDLSIAFLVAVSPCGLTPAEQMDYAVGLRLRQAGYPAQSVRSALALRAAINDCYRQQPIDRAKALALIDAARRESWFEPAQLPDPRESADDGWAADLDFDVRPAIRALNMPVLAIFGARDRWVPVERSVAVWRAELGADARLTAALLPEAGHSLTTAFDYGDADERGPLHPAYEETLEAWLRGALAR
jgi:uncharacterized protein